MTDGLEVLSAVYLVQRDFCTPQEMRTAFARLHDVSIAIVDCPERTFGLQFSSAAHRTAEPHVETER